MNPPPVKPLRILLVDDTPENIKLVEKYIRSRGHEVFISTNGREAIDQFAAIQPDMVLMDVMMPEMDGYEATRRIRELSQERWIPIIFLSALSDSENLIKGLEAGGDDYLTKPIKLRILDVKIKVMQRISAMQDRIALDSVELAAYHAQSKAEKDLVREVLKRINRRYQSQENGVDVWYLPAEQPGGDVIALHRPDNDRLYMMVADATGHGLVAAFSKQPVTQIFYDMAEQGSNLPSIVTHINDYLYELLPPDQYVAATIAIMDESKKVIEIWNGGNPPAVIFDGERKLENIFTSNHPPLGLLPKDEFDSDIQMVDCNRNSQLLICSDGVFEVIGNNHITEPEVVLSELAGAHTTEPVFDVVKKAIKEKLGNDAGPDDISILGVNCRMTK